MGRRTRALTYQLQRFAALSFSARWHVESHSFRWGAMDLLSLGCGWQARGDPVAGTAEAEYESPFLHGAHLCTCNARYLVITCLYADHQPCHSDAQRRARILRPRPPRSCAPLRL